MKQNQNARQQRQGRPNQQNNQKRSNKGRNNQNRNQGHNAPNRQIDSRGPAGGLRGNAKQLYEKYTALAQERRASDRLESESLGQHADHYYRLYAEFAAAEAATQAAQEKERARKIEEEVERQANATNTPPPPATNGGTVPQDAQTSAPAQTKAKPRKNAAKAGDVKQAASADLFTPNPPSESRPAVMRQAINIEIIDPKPEEAVAPKAETPATEAVEPPKKRRGRPPKIKPAPDLLNDDTDIKS